MSYKAKLDNFGKLALIACMFSLCTTRPIGREKAIATFERTPDKVDIIMMKCEALQAKEESLSNVLNYAIANHRRVPELRPIKRDTVRISSHPFGHGFDY